jgi:hypothetical protein
MMMMKMVVSERSVNLQSEIGEKREFTIAFGDEVPRKPFSEKGAKLDHPKANNGSTPAWCCRLHCRYQI